MELNTFMNKPTKKTNGIKMQSNGKDIQKEFSSVLKSNARFVLLFCFSV